MKLTREEEDMINMWTKCKVPPREISRMMEEKFHKPIAPKKVRNITMKQRQRDQSNEIDDIKIFMDEDGGKLTWKEDENGDVSAMFISSSKMRSGFQRVKPELLQIDTTFNLEQSRYKVCGFCFVDPETNTTQMAGMALLDAESHENFEFAFNALKDMASGKDDFIFIVDKDMKEVNTLYKVFRNCTVLLCLFHVITYFKKIVASSLIEVHEKHSIFAIFQSLVYAKSEDDFIRKTKAFYNEVHGVYVRPPNTDEPVLLSSYYAKNWEPEADKWVSYKRRHLPTLGDNTNNR